MKKIIATLSLVVLGLLAFGAYVILDANDEQGTNMPMVDAEKSESTTLTTLTSPQELLLSKLKLRTFDVYTGTTVIPDGIDVIQRENKNIGYRFDKEDVSEYGTIVIALLNGTYDIVVRATGYQTMESYFTFHNDSLSVNFNLEPLQPLTVLGSNYLTTLHRRDAMVIVGFVVDDATGQPLENVQVFSEDKKATTESGKDGYFELILPLPANYNEIIDRGKLLFEKSGYKTELRYNFDMWPSGDLILQLRLQTGTGVNTDEVIKKRDASYIIIEE